MSDQYPDKRPESMADVKQGHIVGKVTEVTPKNSLWLRDALDITLEDIEQLEVVVEAVRTYKIDFDSMSMEAEINSRTKVFEALAALEADNE